jgi:pSer/pThr/pTyr-binding forkhead associated (FHA) protein
VIEAVELMIKQPGHADRTVRLPEGATRLGRAEDNEVVLSDVGVSRRHAQVYVSRGEVTVEDLGSGNGTYYNGYRIQSQPVQDGDEIVIDPFVLQFRVRGVQQQAPHRATPAGVGGGGPPPLGNIDRSQPPPARLEVVVGTGMAGSSYPITSRGLSIGRSEDRDVVIPDPAASRHHTQITLQGGEYVLRDMGSANGIFVNAVRVRECTLADGDLMRIGNTEMRFVRYDEGAADNTTQVVQGSAAEAYVQQRDWNEPTIGQPARAVQSSEPIGTRRRSSGRLLAMLFGGMLVFVGMLAVLVLLLVGVFVAIKLQPQSPQAFQASPPRWSLKLPTGLQAAPVDQLFEEGRHKMRQGDRRAALQNFYRVLQTDPGYAYVDKFAFAAGEYMVLDVLQKEFTARASARTDKDAERERLLRDWQVGSRTSRLKAETILKRKFKDDPVVIEALNLTAPQAVVELEKVAADATAEMANGKYDDAAILFAKVLEESNIPATRKQALASLKLSQKEVARASSGDWRKAIMFEAEGKKSDAKATFQAVQKAHPANASAALHLKRLE